MEDRYFDTYDDGQAILDDIASRLSVDRAMTCGFDWVYSRAPVLGGHEYTVMGVNRNTAGTVTSVVLRNPHGPAGEAAAVTVTGDQLFACRSSIAWGTVA